MKRGTMISIANIKNPLLIGQKTISCLDFRISVTSCENDLFGWLPWHAFLKSPEDFSGPKSYFMCRLFTNRDSVLVCFES